MSGCLSPILVGTDLKSLVRCGRCRYCRIRRKQAWVGRLRLEAEEHPASRFLTLTYSEEHVHLGLDYEVAQLWLKRYRYYNGEFRFFLVGEYGGRKERPHWHCLIFGHAQKFIQGHMFDDKSWPYGKCTDGSVTLQSIGYVAGYTLKGAAKGELPVRQSSRQPGIGMRYIVSLAQAAAEHFRDRQLPSWPGRYSVGSDKYPLCDAGLATFQREFVNAGGFPPVSPTPEDRHVMAMLVRHGYPRQLAAEPGYVSLSEAWGTRIDAENRARSIHDLEQGVGSLNGKKARGSL